MVKTNVILSASSEKLSANAYDTLHIMLSLKVRGKVAADDILSFLSIVLII